MCDKLFVQCEVSPVLTICQVVEETKAIFLLQNSHDIHTNHNMPLARSCSPMSNFKKTLLITAVHRNKPEIKGILRLEVGQDTTFKRHPDWKHIVY